MATNKRRTKAEKAFDDRVDTLRRECTDRVQIEIWDLKKVQEAAEKAAKEHPSDDAAAKTQLSAFIATIRKN